MSRRKKKLYARKYQPWYHKKVELARSMEDTLLGRKGRISAALRKRALDAAAKAVEYATSKLIGEPGNEAPSSSKEPTNSC